MLIIIIKTRLGKEEVVEENQKCLYVEWEWRNFKYGLMNLSKSAASPSKTKELTQGYTVRNCCYLWEETRLSLNLSNGLQWFSSWPHRDQWNKHISSPDFLGLGEKSINRHERPDGLARAWSTEVRFRETIWGLFLRLREKASKSPEHNTVN